MLYDQLPANIKKMLPRQTLTKHPYDFLVAYCCLITKSEVAQIIIDCSAAEIDNLRKFTMLFLTLENLDHALILEKFVLNTVKQYKVRRNQRLEQFAAIINHCGKKLCKQRNIEALIANFEHSNNLKTALEAFSQDSVTQEIFDILIDKDYVAKNIHFGCIVYNQIPAKYQDLALLKSLLQKRYNKFTLEKISNINILPDIQPDLFDKYISIAKNFYVFNCVLLPEDQNIKNLNILCDSEVPLDIIEENFQQYYFLITILPQIKSELSSFLTNSLAETVADPNNNFLNNWSFSRRNVNILMKFKNNLSYYKTQIPQHLQNEVILTKITEIHENFSVTFCAITCLVKLQLLAALTPKNFLKLLKEMVAVMFLDKETPYDLVFSKQQDDAIILSNSINSIITLTSLFNTQLANKQKYQLFLLLYNAVFVAVFYSDLLLHDNTKEFCRLFYSLPKQYQTLAVLTNLIRCTSTTAQNLIVHRIRTSLDMHSSSLYLQQNLNDIYRIFEMFPAAVQTEKVLVAFLLSCSNQITRKKITLLNQMYQIAFQEQCPTQPQHLLLTFFGVEIIQLIHTMYFLAKFVVPKENFKHYTKLDYIVFLKSILTNLFTITNNLNNSNEAIKLENFFLYLNALENLPEKLRNNKYITAIFAPTSVEIAKRSLLQHEGICYSARVKTVKQKYADCTLVWKSYILQNMLANSRAFLGSLNNSVRRMRHLQIFPTLGKDILKIILEFAGFNLEPEESSLIREYSLCLMPESTTVVKFKNVNKIYFRKQNEQLEYRVISPSGQHILALIDINVTGDLTQEFLDSNKLIILDLLSNRGHIYHIKSKQQQIFASSLMPVFSKIRKQTLLNVTSIATVPDAAIATNPIAAAAATGTAAPAETTNWLSSAAEQAQSDITEIATAFASSTWVPAFRTSMHKVASALSASFDDELPDGSIALHGVEALHLSLLAMHTAKLQAQHAANIRHAAPASQVEALRSAANKQDIASQHSATTLPIFRHHVKRNAAELQQPLPQKTLKSSSAVQQGFVRQDL